MKEGGYGGKTALVQFKRGNTVILEISYCDRGFPIFDAVRKFEVHLSKEIWYNNGSKVHMKSATLRVKEALESGMITEKHLADWIHESYALKGETLSASELANEVAIVKDAIVRGERQIPGFTWHHHQELGRMELIPRWIHKEAKHTGGDSLWPRNPAVKGE